MHKIFSTGQIRAADRYTIEHEPVASIDLMERAAGICFQWIREHLDTGKTFTVVCGQGNNGGDGLVIARLLSGAGCRAEVWSVIHSASPSGDFSINLERLKNDGLVPIREIREAGDIPVLPADRIVIDALFGSGLGKPAGGIAAEVIRAVNGSGCFVLAIDSPSGMFCDQPTDPKAGEVVRAHRTLTLQAPRLAFIFPENEEYVGEWTILPIGLHPAFLEELETRHYLTGEEDIRTLLHPRPRAAHKGNFGHGLLISGGYGKMGAAILGTRAALRTGAGLITAHIPARGYTVLQTAVPEAMASIDPDETMFTESPPLDPYTAIGTGPGIGTSPATARALRGLIQQAAVPMVFDADALNILAENKTWLGFLPAGSILTPHPKEFERLAGKTANGFERNERQRNMSVRFGIIILLKGYFTCISFPDGRCYFNPTGNPGMATGGSGDVLTGMILGLLAQGYPPAEAALIGAFLHGRAGDLAADHFGENAMIAGDITDFLPDAYLSVTER